MTSPRLSERLHQSLFDHLKKGDQARVAGLAGINPSTIRRWRTGAEPLNPRLDTIEKLAAAMGVQAERLLGVAVERAHTVSDKVPPYDAPHGYTLVPFLEDHVGAGPGSQMSEAVADVHALRVDWVRTKTSGQLVRVRVHPHHEQGSSMTNTILPGAILTVDLAVRQVDQGKIYVVRDNEHGVTVKRVFVEAKHRLICTSDNRRFPPFILELEHGQPLNLAVLGRVLRWEQGEDG